MKRLYSFALVICMLFSLTVPIHAVETENSYDDTKNHWANTEISKWSNNGLLKGSDGKFRPNDNIKRAEMAVITDRLMDYQETGDNVYLDLDEMIADCINISEEVSKDYNGTIIVNVSGVTLKDMIIDGDLIISEGVGDDEVKIDNVKITGEVFVKGGGENSVYFDDCLVNGELEVNKSDGKIKLVETQK